MNPMFGLPESYRMSADGEKRISRLIQ